MVPSYDPPSKAASNDCGAWMQEERAGWEETDHYRVVYDKRLVQLVDKLAEHEGWSRLEAPTRWIAEWQELNQ